MTRWLVDFKVASDLVLDQAETKLRFASHDGTYEIHMSTREELREGEPPELYLSTQVLLDADEPSAAVDAAKAHLRTFLGLLSVTTSTYYDIASVRMVVDWTPGLTRRRFLLYRKFANPELPFFGLTQGIFDSVARFLKNEIPEAISLAVDWWARGARRPDATEQFMYFWFALELLAEASKSPERVPDRCALCRGPLFCQTCDRVTTHRPYPKQAIEALIKRHVTGEPEAFFEKADKARNALMHGTNPREIEHAIGVTWSGLADDLGPATWAALITALVRLSQATATGREVLEIAQANTFTQYDFHIAGGMAMSVNHADPNSPQIEEFQPDFKWELGVHARPPQGATPEERDSS